MELIITYFQNMDSYTKVALGILFFIIFITIIYKNKTNTQKNIEWEEIDNSEIDNARYTKPELVEQSYDEKSNQTVQQESTIMIWLIIDIVSILVIVAILYTMYFKKNMGILSCVISSILGYYIVVKPTLFNTKSK